MNHTLHLNGRHYLLRQEQNKLLLLSHPELTLLHKYYIFTSFSTTNPASNQIMTIYQNQITVLKVVVTPMQIATVQQSFIDWSPQGGILMQHQIILYNDHRIVFYNRSTILQKNWEVEVIQSIKEVKGCPGDQTVAMMVKDPGNSLFLWSMLQPSVKPTQQIILTEPILQWEFIQKNVLLILTPEELRVYIKSQEGDFNLYHFYLLSGRSFCWVQHPWVARTNRLSVSSVVVMEGQGIAKVLELYGIERRVLQSDMQIVGKLQLKYKTVNMKRVIGCWQERKSIYMVCSTKYGELFTLQLSKRLQVVSSKAYQEILGADINDFYAKKDLVLVRDRTRWKYYQIKTTGSYELLHQVDCEKAFIGTQNTFYFLHDQAIHIQTVGGSEIQSIGFKYPNPDKIHYLFKNQNTLYLIAGIRCFKVIDKTVSSAGFTLRNQKAELLKIDSLNHYLTYKIGDQNMLLNFKIYNQKITAGLIKSSNKQLIGMSGGRWVTQDITQIILGQGDKELCSFSISKLLKMLDSQNKTISYSIGGIPGNGIIIQMRNYIFFLQVVNSQKGAELVLVKRMNTVLFHRFNPYAHSIKLVDPERLTFWVGNKVKSLGSRINPVALLDPYSPPETLTSKQLQLKKLFPPHHPRVLQMLIQTNKISLCLETLKEVRKWFLQKQHSLEQLYRNINLEFVTEILEKAREEDLSRWTEQQKQQQTQFLHQFAAEVLEKMEAIQLREKTPFNFESILSAIQYYIINNKTVDYFSQAPLILSKSNVLKGKPLSSMYVAHLLHSLNKQQAAKELKTQKASWDWLRDNSVPFWIGNIQMLKHWIEQIAMQQYRNKKEPFDCLLWYVLVGKISIVATLFKKHRMDSKEHEAIANFLQRDFSEAKNRTAAIKNAYVLIDKKRYLHALAFFILGGSMQDCIRLGADRLKDLNLAYIFTLFFKQANQNYLFEQMRKGDGWMKHISYKLSGQHIRSYNCLFEETDYQQWMYSLPLTGFHPQMLQFAQKVKNSVSVKRQLQQQNQPSQASRDIFADFYGGEEEKIEEAPKQKQFLMGEKQELISHAINFYIKEGLPLMALTLDKQNIQASQAYAFELYKLGGKFPPQLQQTILALEDTLGAVKCFISTYNYADLIQYLNNSIEKLKYLLQKVQFVQIIKTKKYILGQILHFAFCSHRIVIELQQHKGNEQHREELSRKKQQLKQLSNLSCVIVCLVLQNYEDLQSCIQKIGGSSNTDPHPDELWIKFKLAYNKILEEKKSKQLKQMDHFQHAFIATYRSHKKQEIYRNDLSLTAPQTSKLFVKFCVFKYICQQQSSVYEQIVKIKIDIEEYIRNWVPSNTLADIQEQFRIFLRQGTKAKLKLPTLGSVFSSNFNQIFDIMGTVHEGYFRQNILTPKVELKDDLQAIQVFRNRTDGVKSFILNKHEGNGMECIVLLKKLMKKFQLCQNLARRDRTRDGYGLMVQDGGYTQISHADPNSYLKQKHPFPVEQALKHIIQQRKGYGSKDFPRSCKGFSDKNYIRQIEAPYLDHNELNSIECHPYLPFYLIGGKGLVQVAHLSSLRNFDRVKCSGMSQIIKLHACGQRMGVLDSGGNFSIYNFDPSFQNNCVYTLKKASITNFCYLNPSVIAMVSSTSLHIIDTLIHPNRQLKFKQNFNKEPIALSVASDNNIVILRKHDILIYDIRNQKLQNSRQLKGRGGRSLFVDDNLVYIGTNDSKVKVFDIYGSNEDGLNIKVGLGDQKDREKINIDHICGHDDITVAQSSQGSIYYLPKISRDALRI